MQITDELIEYIGDLSRLYLSDEEKESIDRVLQALYANLQDQPPVIVTYFLPDQKKDGGAYVTVTGALKRIDLLERRLIFTDGTLIPIDAISQLQGPSLPEEPLEP